ncbi:hypothetical protein BH10BAC2_BH10BAC2_19160 [soil metagenome]
MLSSNDEAFIQYWGKNRDRKKKLLRQLFVGLPLGLLISGGVIFSLDLGWYSRANMVANSQTNPYVLLIAVLAITVFTTIFYIRFKWDINEQHYKELLAKKQRQENVVSTDAAN